MGFGDKYLAIRALSMLKSGDTTAFFNNIDNIVRSEDKDSFYLCKKHSRHD